MTPNQKTKHDPVASPATSNVPPQRNRPHRSCKHPRSLWIAVGSLTAFLLWTALVCLADVRPIGPLDSEVGLSPLNRWFHSLTGVHMSLYTLTDWLGLIPFAVVFGFAAMGLLQWIRRKQLRRVDYSILLLGGFYATVLTAYALFEVWVINYRPVLIQGLLEASYPSSTTVLASCVIPTAILQARKRLPHGILRRLITILGSVFTAFMVIVRLLSGVHWLSDIVGGVLLSIGLVSLYVCLLNLKNAN